MSTSVVIAVAAGASALAAVINLVIAVVLARIARRNAIGSVFIWAADLLSNDESVKARRELFRDLRIHRETSGTHKEMEPSLRENFEKVCRTYDLVGIATHNKMLPHGIIATEWGNSIIELHELCEPYLNSIRKERGSDFWNNFSQLYIESVRIWKPGAERSSLDR